MRKDSIIKAYDSINAVDDLKERLKASCTEKSCARIISKEKKNIWIIPAATVAVTVMALFGINNFHKDEELTFADDAVTNFYSEETVQTVVSENETAEVYREDIAYANILVVDENSEPVPNLKVVFYPEDESKQYVSGYEGGIILTDGNPSEQTIAYGSYVFGVYDCPNINTSSTDPNIAKEKYKEVSRYYEEFSIEVDENTEDITLVWNAPTPNELNKADDSAFALTLLDENSQPLQGYYVFLTPSADEMTVYDTPGGYSTEFGGYLLSLTNENGTAYWVEPLEGEYSFSAYKSLPIGDENSYNFLDNIVITVDENSAGDEIIFHELPSDDELLENAHCNTYCFPIKDVPSRVLAEFEAYEAYKKHNGIDIAAEDENAEISAAYDGAVMWAGYSDDHPEYGYYIEIFHGDGLMLTTRYAHCSEVYVSAGDYVEKGQVVGMIGSTGYTAEECLHFDMILNGEYLDPDEFEFENRVDLK